VKAYGVFCLHGVFCLLTKPILHGNLQPWKTSPILPNPRRIMRTQIEAREALIASLKERIRYLKKQRDRFLEDLKKRSMSGDLPPITKTDNVRDRELPRVEATIQRLKPRLANACKIQQNAKRRYYAY